MAAKIHELRAQRDKLNAERVAKLRAAQTKAKEEKRKLTAEELAADDAAQAEILELDGELDIEERILSSERRHGSSLPHTSDDEPVPGAGPVAERPSDRPVKSRGFGSIGGHLKAVIRAAKGPEFTDKRLFAAASGANEAVDSEGGFLVDEQDGGTLLGQTYATGILASKVRKQPVGAGFNGVKFRLLDETSRANGSRFGGIQAYWAAEADSFTGTKPKFRNLELRLQKLIGLMYLTDELAEDAVALEGYVNEWFPQEFGFKLDDAIFQGPGAGIPLGFTVSPAKVKISAEGGQTTKTIVSDNVEKMFAAMPASSLLNAEWFINVEVWPQLFKLSHAVGTGGVPMFLLPGGLVSAPFGTLLGRPITPIEQAAALGTEGDIVLADPTRYMLIDKGPIKTAASIHVKFLTDEMALRWVLRIDGQPIPNAPITPYKGAQALSPFITLAPR